MRSKLSPIDFCLVILCFLGIVAGIMCLQGCSCKPEVVYVPKEVFVPVPVPCVAPATPDDPKLPELAPGADSVQTQTTLREALARCLGSVEEFKTALGAVR